MLIRTLAALFAMGLVGCGSSATSSECEGLTAEQCAEPDGGTHDAGEPDGAIPDGGMPADAPLVVDVDWLGAHLGDPDVQPIDTRRSGYDASRIPGAIHLRPGELAAEIDGVSSQVASPMQAQPALRAAGLRNDVIAVV